MDFLKSAVASISKGPAFPYSFNDRIDVEESIWTLHNGARREDGLRCSIFSFDVNANRSRLALAKNALRKFRTLRHPGIVRVLDTVETDQLIYIATERVTPLTWSLKRRSLSVESLKWGLYSVAKTLKFINDEAMSVHGNIRAASIFTGESGEWKIGGLDILSSLKDDDAVIFSQGSLVPGIGPYTPPEVVKSGWDCLRKNPTHAIDAHSYGILISECFKGATLGPPELGSVNGVPLDMQTGYKRLTHAAPKMRLSVGHFLEQGRRSGGFFDTPLINMTEDVDNLGLKSQAEKEVFLSELEKVAESDDFPEEFLQIKILPELLKSVEFGGGGPKSFALVMKIASKLSEDEYDNQITPVVVRLFGNPDRALRVCLLDNLPLMIDHLSQKVVTDKIFPQMVTGFGDLAPVVREQTVKAVLIVVPKLSDRVINGELLRHLAKTANDEQPGIRTNTTICLGKIARNLGASSRAKVLSAAFSRSLRDPFVHARNAALMALAATADVFNEEECATKLLPLLCPPLVDKEKIIRDQANRTLNIYVERVRKYSMTLPESVLPPPEAASAPGSRINTPQPSNQWMGWAISSFTNKLSSASGEIQPDSNGVKPGPLERSSSLPPTPGTRTRPGPVGHPTPSAPAVPKAPSNLRDSTTFSERVAEAEDFGDGWGDMDDDPAAAWDEPARHSANASSHSSRPSTSSMAYDDGGEPDFEGWLNAQAQSRAKKPLPKGLAKKTPSASVRPVASPVPRSAPSSTSQKSAESKAAPAKVDEEDWGDAWG